MTLSCRRSFDLFWLLPLILLAWGLRLYRLDAQSLWYDEGVTATLAQRSLVDLTAWTARDIQPPLYYYVVWGWGRLAGWSEWSLRFVSVWWGVLSVPLLAVLTQRLTRSRAAAVTAALLTAFHPLLLYYSQEARMYTMLVALGLLAGYQLARIDDGEARWPAWVSYALVATLAVYTHYFAFFLLLALGVAFLLKHYRRLWVFLSAHLAILLIYLAWSGALFYQLRVDRSYWQGQLKVWEAFQSVLLRFTQGETVLERDAGPTLLLYGGVTLFLLVASLWQARWQPTWRRALRYALCWLLIPLVGVLTLAAFIPKFNARYVMVALPGLLLLWSGGIGALVTVDEWPMARPSVRHFLGWLGALLATLLLLTGFWTANRNWFTDIAFTKAEWRQLADYVREHKGANEAVILVSGHAWPIWDYYAPDLPAIRLPDLAILDVDAVLDFEQTGETLHAALQGKEGAWLVNWQDEVVDPNGVTPNQLLAAAQEKPVEAQFWQLRLRHFVKLDPNAIQATPLMDQKLAANFGNQVELQGYRVTPEGDLLLFWRLGKAPSTPLPDLHVHLQTATAAGFAYAFPTDRRPAAYDFPVMRWQPEQTVMGRIPAADWAGAGALPGQYKVQLGVYAPAGDPAGLDLLDGSGNQLGKAVTLAVGLPQTTPAEPPAGAIDDTEIITGVRLAFPFDAVAAEPGQDAPLRVDWFLERKLTQPLELTLRWRAAKGAPVLATTPMTMTAVAPMTAWPVEQWLRQIIPIQPPPTLGPGDYLLEVVAKGRENPARRTFTVLPSSRNFTPPPLALVTDVGFGLPVEVANRVNAQIHLLGLQQPFSTTVAMNEAIIVTLVWQAGATAPNANYRATLQLLGAEGPPVAQVDEALPEGTSTWLADQVESQTLTLRVPTIPGDYRLILALYHPEEAGFPRLFTSAGEDFVALGVVRVTP
jgi:4-amino-4-deoxy-L-arabinose transferase-like glycosyltransferase